MADNDDGLRGPPTKKKKKSETERRTIRCQLEINNSGDQYTEVSWYDLVAKEETKNRKAGTVEKSNKANDSTEAKGLNPFASDDEDDLKALAAQFEKKYADTKPKKSVAKRRKNYDDLGEGYDESDPFIDNSECFDENVPQEITTAYGGFYINTGMLEFKDNKNVVYELLSDSSNSDSETPRKEKKTVAQKKKSSVPTNGIPVVPVKKPKVINTKRKARIITTAINKGPKIVNGINKKAETSKKLNPSELKTEPGKKLAVKDKLGKSSDHSTTDTSADEIRVISNTSTSGIQITAVSSLTTLPSQTTSARSSPAITSSPTVISVGGSSSNNSQKSASSVSRIESVTVPAKSTVATGSTVVKSGTSSLTTPSAEKKDLKSERKTGAASAKAASKSSPKPPELIDLEAQLNELNDLFEPTQSPNKSQSGSPKSSKVNSQTFPSSKSALTPGTSVTPVTTHNNSSAISITKLSSQQGGSSRSSEPSSSSSEKKSAKSSGKGDGMKGSGSSGKNSPVPTISAGKSNSSMFSHNPASILASLSSPGSSTKTVKSNTLEAKVFNGAFHSVSSSATKQHQLAAKSNSISSSVLSTGTETVAVLDRVAPSLPINSANLIVNNTTTPTNRGQSANNKSTLKSGTKQPSNAGARRTASPNTGTSTTMKKSANQQQLSGSELSQQLGRKAVQELLKSNYKPNDELPTATPAAICTTPTGGGGGGGISVKSMFNESLIGVSLPSAVSGGSSVNSTQYPTMTTKPTKKAKATTSSAAKTSPSPAASGSQLSAASQKQKLKQQQLNELRAQHQLQQQRQKVQTSPTASVVSPHNNHGQFVQSSGNYAQQQQYTKSQLAQTVHLQPYSQMVNQSSLQPQKPALPTNKSYQNKSGQYLPADTVLSPQYMQQMMSGGGSTAEATANYLHQVQHTMYGNNSGSSTPGGSTNNSSDWKLFLNTKK